MNPSKYGFALRQTGDGNELLIVIDRETHTEIAGIRYDLTDGRFYVEHTGYDTLGKWSHTLDGAKINASEHIRELKEVGLIP